MAYSYYADRDRLYKPTRTFLCDVRSDIESLPTQNVFTDDFPTGVPAFSDALVLEDSSIWILGNNGVWTEVTYAVELVKTLLGRR